MKINELLYNKRIEKNLTMKQVADAVGEFLICVEIRSQNFLLYLIFL